MNNYKSIAVQYLKLNKRRTILTILGTALTVFFLYILLNVGFSYMDYSKEEIILKVGDYEMILYTETPEQIQTILNDPVVERAYTGEWYHVSLEKELDQALFVTGDNPYRINKNFEHLTETYGVGGSINQALAAFYLQGSESNIIYITILFFFLVAYLFAIFGVGVIRNSIQLSLFEQIKDYGNLRCIGASVGQLRAIIYLQGFVMEVAGLAIGVAAGQVVLWIAGVFINFNMAMHVLPIVLIMIAYFGDLYFAMEENCKLVTGMSPVSALKGEFRIRKEKIKRRKKRIYGRLFGVDGDYAYKNLMRSPGRFFKSAGVMFLGITALIACLGTINIFGRYIKDEEERYGYYQLYYKVYPMPGKTSDEIQKNLPSTELLQKVKESDVVTEGKRVYETEALMADENELYNHLNESYLNETVVGDMYKRFKTMEEQGESKPSIRYSMSVIQCHGYDEEDYARYEEHLIEGTLDTSENGIVIVNGTTAMKSAQESLKVEYVETEITTYELGDTIEIVNPDMLEKMVIERVQAEKENADEEKEENEFDVTEYSKVIMECKEELLAQGEYTSYVVEGILEKDTNQDNTDFTIVLPLEKYYKMTGKNENAVTGMRYHIDGNVSVADYSTFEFYEDEKSYGTSCYMLDVGQIVMMRDMAKYVLAFVLFIVAVSSVNIINTTASNIRLRRKEFAQLRVIGVSKRRLIKIVLLEGVIMAIVANLLGFIVGNLISYGVYYFMNMILGMDYSVDLLGMVLGLLLSVAVLCGSVYFPMMSMKQELAADLAASGE